MKESLPGLPGLPRTKSRDTQALSQFQDLAWLHCVSSFVFVKVFISVVWYTCVADWPVCVGTIEGYLVAWLARVLA